MADRAIDAFKRKLNALRRHPVLSPLMERGKIDLARLSREQVMELLKDKSAAYHLLLTAAGLNRTTLRDRAKLPEAQTAPKGQRSAYVVLTRLRKRGPQRFDSIVSATLERRLGDLGRIDKGEVEDLFRDRLADEGVPILMRPPVREVPGLLVERRRPDGIYPDPAQASPLVYLEIKNIKRVRDDIQKRLYELAEASLEMKLLYGDLRLVGFNLTTTDDVAGNQDLRARAREQILRATPVVVGLFLCPRVEAERYRAGAEAFVDRVFFQEEMVECVAFLREALERHGGGG